MAKLDALAEKFYKLIHKLAGDTVSDASAVAGMSINEVCDKLQEEIGNGNLDPVDELAELADVALETPSNGQVLAYDGTTSKWKNAEASGGAGNFFVTITSDELSTKFSSDKTVAEIGGALEGGLLPVAIYDTGVYALSYVSSAVCFFTNTTPFANSQNKIIGATLNSVIIMSGSESDVVVESTNLTIASS